MSCDYIIIFVIILGGRMMNHPDKMDDLNHQMALAAATAAVTAAANGPSKYLKWNELRKIRNRIHRLG